MRTSPLKPSRTTSMVWSSPVGEKDPGCGVYEALRSAKPLIPLEGEAIRIGMSLKYMSVELEFKETMLLQAAADKAK